MSFSVIKGKPVKFLTVAAAATWLEDRETNYIRCGVFKQAVYSISSFHIVLSLPLPSRKMKRTFEADMIQYKENPKDSTEKLLELINEFGKVAGCKVNIQPSVEFLYPNNEILEKERRKAIPFQSASKNK